MVLYISVIILVMKLGVLSQLALLMMSSALVDKRTQLFGATTEVNQESIIIIIFIILQVLTARMKATLLTTQESQQHLTVQLK